MLVAPAEGRLGQPLGRLAVGFRLERRDPLALDLVLEAVDEVFLGEAAGGLGLVAQEVAARCGRTGCASGGGPSTPTGRAARPGRSSPGPGAPARPTGRPGSRSSPATGFSSSLPGLIRWPPVCFIRFVGFRSNSDCSGFLRSTRSISLSPNAVIWAWPASGSGNSSRVSEATPLSLWHRSHWAACSTGCSFSAKNDSSTMRRACANTPGPNAVSTAARHEGRNQSRRRPSTDHRLSPILMNGSRAPRSPRPGNPPGSPRRRASGTSAA